MQKNFIIRKPSLKIDTGASFSSKPIETTTSRAIQRTELSPHKFSLDIPPLTQPDGETQQTIPGRKSNATQGRLTASRSMLEVEEPKFMVQTAKPKKKIIVHKSFNKGKSAVFSVQEVDPFNVPPEEKTADLKHVPQAKIISQIRRFHLLSNSVRFKEKSHKNPPKSALDFNSAKEFSEHFIKNLYNVDFSQLKSTNPNSPGRRNIIDVGEILQTVKSEILSNKHASSTAKSFFHQKEFSTDRMKYKLFKTEAKNYLEELISECEKFKDNNEDLFNLECGMKELLPNKDVIKRYQHRQFLSKLNSAQLNLA